MQIIDLYSGIGGFSLAGEWMGWRTIQFCEIDKFCQQVLKKHWPDVPIHDDINTLTSEIIKNNSLYNDKEETIITGGVPCQPASIAGKRMGEQDNRWLWPQTIEFIGKFKPAFALLENVAGLISMENGRTLERILSDLENEGYQTESLIIPACGVGAWHRRDRIWIIAHDSGKSTQMEKYRGSRQEWKLPGALESKILRQENRQIGAERIRAGSKDVPDTNKFNDDSSRSETSQIPKSDKAKILKDVSYSNGKGSQRYRGLSECRGQWTTWAGGESLEDIWQSEPNVGRVAHGISRRVDRLKSLGNAIVPQVAYELFKVIDIVIKNDHHI